MSEFASNLITTKPTFDIIIRAARPDDVQPILDMHRRLSADSLYLRYLVPYMPSYIPAHVRHICSRPVDQGTTLVISKGDQIIGFGYYVINAAQPDTAEPALLIEDNFQGRGLGRRLLDCLITAARAQGVRFFDALTHHSNRQMLNLLRGSSGQVKSQLDGSHIAVLLSLAAK